MAGRTETTPWNPSQRAVKRVKNSVSVPDSCPVCEGREVRYARHAEIYYGREYGDWPWALLCDGCRAYVGLHPFTGIPLGTLANEVTREARKQAKTCFYAYMRNANKSRSEAYADLAEAMGVPFAKCHFGWFDQARCRDAQTALLQMTMKTTKGRKDV